MSAPGGSASLSAVAVIPARHASQRLPGKPLLTAAGRTLIEHVYRRVAAAARIGRVIVATDDTRIVDVVTAFGGEARMTSPDHRTGSDRVGELLPGLTEDLVINVQGDEPEIASDVLDRLVEALEQDRSLNVATAACPMPESVAFTDPHAVKVVVGRTGRALYFSRAPIPGSKTGTGGITNADWPLLHVGVYAFRRAALARFLVLPEGDLERIESLEQLRLIENDVTVGVVRCERAPAGIDTPEDFAAFVTRVETLGPDVRW